MSEAVAETPATSDATQAVTPETSTTPAGDTAGQSTTTPDTGTPAAPSGPPEYYALTVPDDGVVTAERRKAFEDGARADGLTNEQAQARLTRELEAFYAQSDADLAQTEADPTYGGKNLAQTQQRAESVLNRFAPKGTPLGDGLRALLQQSGRGNALPLVACLAEIGKAMEEDRPVGDGKGPRNEPKEERLADLMYGTVADQVTQAP